MLLISDDGMVHDERVLKSRLIGLEKQSLDAVRGIIVHQTNTGSAILTLAKWSLPDQNGAHFLIAKDGTIYQTASLKMQTWHVGVLGARCLVELRCTSPAHIDEFIGRDQLWVHRCESTKSVPQRYPSNVDSIGIELAGASHKVKGTDEAKYEPVTEKQNASLSWLIHNLVVTLKVPTTEIFRHPVVSPRKSPSEAETAQW